MIQNLLLFGIFLILFFKEVYPLIWKTILSIKKKTEDKRIKRAVNELNIRVKELKKNFEYDDMYTPYSNYNYHFTENFYKAKHEIENKHKVKLDNYRV